MMKSSNILTLVYYGMILSINSFVNTSAFVVISSRVSTTQLQASDTSSPYALLESQIKNAEAPSQLESVSKQNMAAITQSIKDTNQFIRESVSGNDQKLADLTESIKGANQSIRNFVNNQNLGGITESLNDASQSTKDFLSQLKPSGAGGGDLAVTFNAFWDSLQINEYGPLYVAGIAVLSAGISSRNNAREVSEAKDKANEAAELAETAVKDASRTKELAKSADAEISRREQEIISEKSFMELEVSKLKTESAAAIYKLESDISSLNKTLKITTEESNTASKMIESSNSKAMDKDKELKAVKEMMGIEISNLQEEIVELKQIVQLLMTTKQSESDSKSDAQEDIGVEVREEVVKLKTAAKLLMEEVNTPKKKATREIKAKPLKKKNPSRKEIEMKEEAEAKAKSEADAKAEAKAKSEADAKAEANAKAEAETKMKAESVAKIQAEEKAKTGAGNKDTDTDNPWGSLKKSTLNSKTKAQLTAYLEQRDIDVVASMKKADLINTIQKL